jgi:hypothetical protein
MTTAADRPWSRERSLINAASAAAPAPRGAVNSAALSVSKQCCCPRSTRADRTAALGRRCAACYHLAPAGTVSRTPDDRSFCPSSCSSESFLRSRPSPEKRPNGLTPLSASPACGIPPRVVYTRPCDTPNRIEAKSAEVSPFALRLIAKSFALRGFVYFQSGTCRRTVR